MLLDNFSPRTVVLADKAYDADRIRELMKAQGGVPKIPAKSSRKWKPCFRKRLFTEADRSYSAFTGCRRTGRVARSIQPRQLIGPWSHLTVPVRALESELRQTKDKVTKIVGLSGRHCGYILYRRVGSKRSHDFLSAGPVQHNASVTDL